MLDGRGRPLHNLRVSITDRCNMRCTYCMPSEVFGPGHAFLPRSDLLTYEEIDAVVAALAPRGLRKVRITGGEPLLRRDLDRLVRMVASRGIEVALTTNGLLLAERAEQLAEAGLDRVTVSLDALDPVVFESITETPGRRVDEVLEGIAVSQQAGLGPVKVNAVIRRGMNEGEVIRLADRFHGSGVIVRFIEFMDVGSSNGWRRDDVVTAAEMRAMLAVAGHRLEPMEAGYRGEVATRWRHVDGGGEIGFITSISNPFCGDCTRARLAADGRLHTCLFATGGTDLRPILRTENGVDETILVERLEAIWSAREDRYSEVRAVDGETIEERVVPLPMARVEMSYIGG